MPRVARMTSADRRTNRRVIIDAPVGMAIRKGVMRGWFCRRPQFEGTLRDASIGGMLCVAGQAIAQGSVVKLWLQVELDKCPRTLCLTGDVVWSQRGENGGTNTVGIHLRARPSDALNAWVRTMIDELRIKDGAPPL